MDPKTEALDHLPDARAAYEGAYDAFIEAVRMARGVGASWGEIAPLVGCSRQAAHGRWRHLDEQ